MKKLFSASKTSLDTKSFVLFYKNNQTKLFLKFEFFFFMIFSQNFVASLVPDRCHENFFLLLLIAKIKQLVGVNRAISTYDKTLYSHLWNVTSSYTI